MAGSTNSKLILKTNSCLPEAYRSCIADLLHNDKIREMHDFIQHGSTTCLEHCFQVSYTSYQICRSWGLDFRSAARGGLLHDFFLYDWHTARLDKGWHGFRHPQIALANAGRLFSLNDREKDIIAKHMWPLTVKVPKYPESLIVSLVDKYSAAAETAGFRHNSLRLFFEY